MQRKSRAGPKPRTQRLVRSNAHLHMISAMKMISLIAFSNWISDIETTSTTSTFRTDIPMATAQIRMSTGCYVQQGRECLFHQALLEGQGSNRLSPGRFPCLASAPRVLGIGVERRFAIGECGRLEKS